ncbi:MAG: helix-turn-helix domain-containing protein [Solirubrobacteraceae bacterium]
MPGERSKHKRPAVALLDADPDLGAGLDEGELRAARRLAVAATMDLETPGWDLDEVLRTAADGWLGLFVVHGLMIRRVTIGRRSACELFGPGDLVRPWDTDGEYAPLHITVAWHVLKPTRLAVLDSAFALRIARWPSITSQIVGRVAQRARYLALTQAVTHLPRVYARLLILFWLLAERWGTVSPEGVYVTLPLTHEILAMLVGAHRPPVTIALQRLSRAGLLTRARSDRWLLTNLAVQRLGEPQSLTLIDAEARDSDLS